VVLSKRERYIGFATAGVVALLVLDHFLISPLFARRTQVETDAQTMEIQSNQAKQLFASSPRMNVRWKEMVAAGLKSDLTEAQSQAMQSLNTWAHDAGVTISSLQPDPVDRTSKKDLQQPSFRLSGAGSMRAVTRFLWSVQTARIPMRVITLDLSSRKEGTDDLTMNLTVSTLALSPQSATAVAGGPGAANAPRPTAGAGAGTTAGGRR
jgi:hypothetical protein